MTNKTKLKKTSLLLTGLGGLALGLGSFVPAYAASEADSDLVKFLQKDDKKATWSDYKKEDNGHEVIKNLLIKNDAREIKIGQIDADNFKYDDQSEDMNADHVALKDVNMTATGKMTLTIKEADISKLKSAGRTYSSETKLSDIVLKRKVPEQYKQLGLTDEQIAEIEKPVKVDNMTANINVDNDDFKFDIVESAKDSMDLSLKGEMAGMKKLFDLSEANKGSKDSLDPQILLSVLLTQTSIKSLDLNIKDRGMVADALAAEGAKSSYDDNLRACIRDFGGFAPDPKAFCTPITNVVTGKDKNLNVQVHPKEPFKIAELLMAFQGGDPSALKEAFEKTNLKISN